MREIAVQIYIIYPQLSDRTNFWFLTHVASHKSRFSFQTLSLDTYIRVKSLSLRSAAFFENSESFRQKHSVNDIVKMIRSVKFCLLS